MFDVYREGCYEKTVAYKIEDVINKIKSTAEYLGLKAIVKEYSSQTKILVIETQEILIEFTISEFMDSIHDRMKIIRTNIKYKLVHTSETVKNS